MSLLSEGRRSYVNGPGIVVVRWGGWSPRPTGGGPEKRGLWAFIYPYIETFLAGATDSEGIVSESDDHDDDDYDDDDDAEIGEPSRPRPSRLELGMSNKRPSGQRDPSLGLRYTRYVGPIYTRFNMGQKNNEEWTKTTADELRKYIFGKSYTEEFTSRAKSEKKPDEHMFYNSKNWNANSGRDLYEVFIPDRGGKFLPYEDDPRSSSEEREELPDVKLGRKPGEPRRSKLLKRQEDQDRKEYSDLEKKTLSNRAEYFKEKSKDPYGYFYEDLKSKCAKDYDAAVKKNRSSVKDFTKEEYIQYCINKHLQSIDKKKLYLYQKNKEREKGKSKELKKLKMNESILIELIRELI
jgi:hypothetical protein